MLRRSLAAIGLLLALGLGACDDQVNAITRGAAGCGSAGRVIGPQLAGPR